MRSRTGFIDENKIGVTAVLRRLYDSWLIGHYQIWKRHGRCAVTDLYDEYNLSDFN